MNAVELALLAYLIGTIFLTIAYAGVSGFLGREADEQEAIMVGGLSAFWPLILAIAPFIALIMLAEKCGRAAAAWRSRSL